MKNLVSSHSFEGGRIILTIPTECSGYFQQFFIIIIAIQSKKEFRITSSNESDGSKKSNGNTGRRKIRIC
jgi:hypothetical protein